MATPTWLFPQLRRTAMLENAQSAATALVTYRRILWLVDMLANKRDLVRRT